MYKGVVLAYLLLLIPAIVSWFEKLKLEKDLVVSSLRALVQVSLVATVLLYFFKLPLSLNLLLILLMGIAGTFIASERAKKIPFSKFIAFLALLTGYLPVFALLFATGILKIVPNILVPISGMLLGNGTKTVSLVYSQVGKTIDEHNEIIEAAFLDGADYIEASKFLLKDVIYLTLVPQIDGMKILGVVHIPGTMAGLLIGGAKPMDAAAYQLIIVYALVAMSVIVAIMAAYFSFLLTLKSRYEKLSFKTI